MGYFLASSNDACLEDYFNGIAFSENSIVLSNSGLKDYVQAGESIFDLTDGRYSICFNFEKDRYFFTDRTGQDCWFYFKEKSYWVVSNSYYALFLKLIEDKKSVSLRSNVFYAMRLNNSFGDQPYSNNTLVEGIKILPRNCYIKANEKDFEIFSYKPRGKIKNSDEYVSRVIDFVFKWSSRMSQLVDLVGGEKVRCDISGGVDSRVVMALLNLGGSAKGIKYASNKSWSEDFKVASMLSNYLGFKINNTGISSPRTLSKKDSLQLYLYGNAGVYRNIYYPNHSSSPMSLHLHGAGGGNIRGSLAGSAWQTVNRFERFFNKNEFLSVKNEYLSWFQDNDIDSRSDESSILHYRNFRGRFHFGRNWFRSLTNPLVTPLSSEDIEVMSDYLVEKGEDPRVVQFDILYLCDPVLALLPFDDSSKNFSKDICENSITYLSGIKLSSNLESSNIYGSMPKLDEHEPTGVSVGELNELAISHVNTFIKEFEGDLPKGSSFIKNNESSGVRNYGLVSILEKL